MADSTGFFDHGHDHNIDQDDHLTIFAADYPSLNSSGYASAAFTPLANSKHDSPIEAVTPVKNEDSINFGIGHLHDSPDATSPIHASSVQISSSQASPTQLSPKKFSSKSSRRSSAKKDRHGPRRSGYSQRYKMESSRSACKPCRKRKVKASNHRRDFQVHKHCQDLAYNSSCLAFH